MAKTAKVCDVLNSVVNRDGIKDVAFSISGLLIFNCTVQFIVNPFLNRQIGDTQFGILLSLLSVVAIMAGSVGTGANYSRMIMGLSHPYTNGDYNLYLSVAGAVSILVGTVYLLCIRDFSPLLAVLFAVLMFVTLLRYYGDVEFRLRGNFKGYLLYYVVISVGYCVGMLLYFVTRQWAPVLILGELTAILFVCRFGSIFSPPFFRLSENHRYIWKSALILSVTNIITNLILNADRLLILAFLSGTAVTAFYVASLLGKTLSMITGPLNSVIISRLVRYKGSLTRRAFTLAFLFILALSAVAFAACVAVTPIFIKILYPSIYATARPLVWSAVLGQVFFFSSNVLLTILLRFFGEKYQLYITGAYAVLFCALTIPALIFFGLLGFSYAVLIVNAVKLLICFLFGLRKSVRPPAAA